MTGTVSRGFLDQLERRREQIRADTENMLLEARAQGRTQLSAGEAAMHRQAMQDLRGLDEHIAEIREDLDRSHIPDRYRNLGNRGREIRSAGRVNPCGFDDETLRRAHARLAAGETAVLETRASSSASPLLPAELYPVPTFPRHEARLLDRLPGFALDAPSVEYIQVLTVTGAAQIVGEGQLKPEIVLPPTKQIVTALKLACHGGVTWESINDFDAFTASVQNELLKQVVDLENNQLVYGNPASGGLNGMTTTTGILSLAATGTTTSPPNNWDDIAGGIALLRTGPALAEPDLCLLHPDTWTAIRTQKDLYGRYLATPAPTDQTAESIWDVEVLQSTAFTKGEAVLLDTNLFGRVAVREPLIMRVGYGVVSGQSDFLSNILRWIAEERLNLAVERPAAICHITGLPTAAPTATEAEAKKK
jgi:HK97 family phage major capsid protein